jgi:Fe-S cluster assembly protein SufD
MPATSPVTSTTELTEIRTEELTGAVRFLDDFEAFQRELPASDPGAVRALRRMAIERFATLGFPTLHQEEWRQTNLSPIVRTPFRRPEQGDESAAGLAAVLEMVRPITAGAAAVLVFVNGRLSTRLSTVSDLPPGVLVGGLADALDQAPETIEPWLGQYAKVGDHPFVALNTAFLQDGAVVLVPAGVVVERPIHAVFLSAPVDGQPIVTFPRNLFVVGENAQAAIVETYAGQGIYFTCPVTELVAGPAAVVDHYKLQRESIDAFHIATFQVQAERSCAPSSHSISLGGGLVRNDVNAVLDGEGIDCILNGLYLAEGRQFVDTHMRVEHARAHCGSHELYKGVLDGKARAVFNGLIHVHPGAQKTDAKQSNRNLLLSPDAIANSNPRLEIFADDVKCTHGSTVGQLDEDAVFYLRSRGIGEEAARSLLTWAFASDIVERIRIEPLRRELEEFLFGRLPQGEIVRQAV